MPLTEEILGTNADGSKNEEYCIYCYKDGAFTGDFTMEEMVGNVFSSGFEPGKKKQFLDIRVIYKATSQNSWMPM